MTPPLTPSGSFSFPAGSIPPPPLAAGKRRVVVQRLGGEYRKDFTPLGKANRVGRFFLGILGAVPAAIGGVAGAMGCRTGQRFWNGYKDMGKAMWDGETAVEHHRVTPPPTARPRAEIYDPIEAQIRAGRLKITSSESGTFGYILLPQESAVIFVPRVRGSNTLWDYSKMRKIHVHYAHPQSLENGDTLSDKVDAIVLRKYAECCALVGDKIIETMDQLEARGENTSQYLLFFDVDSKKIALVKDNGHGNFDIDSGAGHVEIRGIDDETWKSLEKIWKDDAKEKSTSRTVTEPEDRDDDDVPATPPLGGGAGRATPEDVAGGLGALSPPRRGGVHIEELSDGSGPPSPRSGAATPAEPVDPGLGLGLGLGGGPPPLPAASAASAGAAAPDSPRAVTPPSAGLPFPVGGSPSASGADPSSASASASASMPAV